MTGRWIFVGDVHGCLDELDELLACVGLQPEDRIGFVGDLINRGPDSVGVVRRSRDLLVRYPGSVVIAGNHEEKVLRDRDHGRPLPDWAVAAAPDDWSFLDGLPLIARVPDLDVVLVHGGFFPKYFEHHEEIGEVSATWRTDRGKLAERQRRFLRIRSVSADGEMVALGQEPPGSRHWTTTYDGREGFCFFGHDPRLAPPDPIIARHATGLDTACCFGGRLTAAVVDPGVHPRDARFVSVAARREYAEPRRLRENI